MSFELSEKVSVPLVEKDVVTESNSNQSNNNRYILIGFYKVLKS